MKFTKIDLLLIVLVLLISSFTWRHIPSLQFTGEGWGFIGTVPPKGIFFQIVYQEVASLDEFTIDRILSGILLPKFGDKIHLYMWFQLAYMLSIDLLSYFIIRQITGNKLAGFLTAFLLGSSFIANFETYSGGGYLYFAQRATLVVPILIAVFFLYLYLTKNFRFYYYLASLASYLFALVMGFFSTYFLPVFIIYPTVYLLFNLTKIRQLFWKLIWVPFPFIIITLHVIRGSRAFTNESLFEFIISKFSYVVIGTLQQLTVITFPLGELFLLNSKLSFEFFSILGITVFIYCSSFLSDFKKNKRWKIVQATMLLSTIAMLLLNVYIQAAETLNTFRSTRYFYFPYLTIAIFWGIFLAGVIKRGNQRLNAYLIIFLIIWFVYNNVHIERRLREEEWVHRANKQTIEILRSWASETKKNPSYMYLPANLGGYGGQFAIQFFSHPDGKVVMQGLEPLDLDKLVKSGLNPKNLYVLLFDPASKDVVDKTEEARTMLGKLQKKR